jgi:glycosyltransferase involved in cell wall biosynthesis
MILVSLVLLSYNQEDFIEEAINSVLCQDYEALEIIISDDCSEDSTFDIIQRTVGKYKGDHQIIVNRNITNLGLTGNLNYAITNLSHGEIIILAAGDDISLPNRTKYSVDLIEKYNLQCISFNCDFIDSNSCFLNKKLYSRKTGLIIYDIENFIKDYKFNIHGATKAFRREVYSYFGPLSRLCPTEDSTLSFRGLILGNIGLSFEVVLNYRVHASNLSGDQNLYLMDFEQIAKQYLIDLELASNSSERSLGFILKSRILNRIEIYRSRMRIIKLLHGVSENSFMGIIQLVGSRYFSLFDKFRLFINWLINK